MLVLSFGSAGRDVGVVVRCRGREKMEKMESGRCAYDSRPSGDTATTRQSGLRMKTRALAHGTRCAGGSRGAESMEEGVERAVRARTFQKKPARALACARHGRDGESRTCANSRANKLVTYSNRVQDGVQVWGNFAKVDLKPTPLGQV